MCLNSLAPARLEIFLRDLMIFDYLLPAKLLFVTESGEEKKSKQNQEKI